MDGKHLETLGLVLELVVLMGEDMNQSLARSGLTTARAAVLWELHQSGPTTQRALAEARGVSARNMTGLLDGLVATGFVTREPHPTDRRASLISFTDHGASVAAAFESGQEEVAEILFGGMPAPRFDGFSTGLKDVVSRLRERLADPGVPR